MKMKNRWHGYNTNRSKPQQEHKHTKFKVSRYDDPNIY